MQTRISSSLKLLQIIFVLSCMIFLFNSCSIYLPKKELSLKENISIIRSNTGRFTPYLSKRQKEVIRLSNLARREPLLLKKYLSIKYDLALEDEIRNKQFMQYKYEKKVPLLRPSFLLTIGSFYHAVYSGFTNHLGHKGFEIRILLSGNFNTLIPNVASGENCLYGSKFKAPEAFISWMNSPGHRANILNPNYQRVGGAGFFHFSEYKFNIVQMFSGPKILDLLIRPNYLAYKSKRRLR